MKNRLIKMMGIILTLAILAGLLMSVVPVSAGTLAWTNATMPSNTNFQITLNSDASVYTMTPDGKTIFAYSNSGTIPSSTTPTAVGYLYKSVDGGLTWSYTNLGSGLNGLNNTNTPVRQLALSPSYATDTRIYAVAGDTLYRSLNGGQNFAADATFEAFNGGAGVGTITNVSIMPWYVSGGGMGVMVNGVGATSTVTGVVGTIKVAVYNDIDGWVPYAGSGASATGSLTYTGAYPSTLPQAATNFTDGSVLLALFSPNFQSDAQILAVVQAAANCYLETKVGNSQWNQTVRMAELKTYNGATIGSGTVGNNSASIAATMAGMAFPSDYNYSSSSANRVFVSLGSTTTGAGPYDVYRANGVLASTGTTVASNLAISQADGSANIRSIAYTGTATAGTLVASFLSSNAIYSTSNVAAGSPTWNLATNPPTGQSAALRFAGTTLYAGTSSADLMNGSVFATSTDYNSFKGISLISVPDLNKLSFSSYKILGDTQFIMLKSSPATGTKVYMIFKSTDKGTTWGQVLTSPSGQLFGTIAQSPAFATDNTVYVTEYQPGGTYTNSVGPAVYKSSDAGATWSTVALTSPHQTISGTGGVPANAFSPIDANSFWFGAAAADGGGIFKSGSYTATATLDGYAPYVIAQTPIGIIVPTTTGEMYISTDQGATFTRLGNINQFSANTVGAPSAARAPAAMAIDVPGKTIYAVDTTISSAIIYKWTVGTDTSWTQVTPVSITTNGTTANYWVQQLTYVGGVLYLTASTTYTYPAFSQATPPNDAVQILRCVNLTRPAGQQTFEVFPNTTLNNNGFAGTIGLVSPAPFTVNTDKFTGNTLYVTLGSITTGVQPNNTSAAIMTYNDALTVAPATATPTPNAQIPTITGGNGAVVGAFNFTWKPVTSPVPLTYSAQIATDADFNGIIAGVGAGTSANATSGTSVYVNNLVPGAKYFFRVRVETPLASPWSPTVPFSVQLAGEAAPGLDAQGRMSPANGATNVPLTPTFTWGAVSGAESYTLQVADNPFFANPTEKKPLTTTIWVWDTSLKANTVYYWRVQAVAAGNASTWVSNAFTTGTGAAPTTGGATSVAPPPAQTVVVPTPNITVTVPAPTGTAAAPETPAYIWVIIAIGAVLVIAVIVLIARTRRV